MIRTFKTLMVPAASLFIFALIFLGFVMPARADVASTAGKFYDFTTPFFDGCGNHGGSGSGDISSISLARGEHICGWGDFEYYLGKTLKLLIALGILISTIAMAWAGFRLIYSQGNPSELARAKSQLWFIIIGFFFMLAAFAIVKFILVSLGVDSGFYAPFIGS